MVYIVMVFTTILTSGQKELRPKRVEVLRPKVLRHAVQRQQRREWTKVTKLRLVTTHHLSQTAG